MAISAEEADMGTVVPLTPEGAAAPELLSGTTSNYHADLYAPGAVLYEFLTGAQSRARGLPVGVMPPSQLRPDVPPRLDKLILSMLATNREDRPQSAEAVLDELRDSTTCSRSPATPRGLVAHHQHRIKQEAFCRPVSGPPGITGATVDRARSPTAIRMTLLKATSVAQLESCASPT